MTEAASSPEIEGRIFVVGVPRSGTTLVQSLLAAHSAVTSFTESHFFDRHFTHLPLRSRVVLTRDPGPRVREFLAENGEDPPAAAAWFAMHLRGVLSSRPLLPFRTLRAARQLLRILDQLTLRRGASHWVEKTPWHLRYLPFLDRLSSAERRLQFVHVIRPGAEVVASLHEASKSWERPYDLPACVQRWNADVALSVRRIGSPTDHFVLYEELTARPAATLRPLLTDLGLDWEPEILERYGRASDSLVTASERGWKSNLDRPIRAAETAALALSAAEQQWVSQSLRHDLYDRFLERAGR